ncbi:thioredoxin family protein [Kineococcus rhizosphaerae]|uniref:thioredoxin family protein n=1 Tax=Kineococcus rhizosphaerae TaxID=559628 RepID=UPI000D0596D9|nr:thioredoxin family protein [Kineococcus rhizosphaerae]
MIVELYSSAFCAPCRTARRVVHDAARLVPAAQVSEFDVADDVERAAAQQITSTPTIVVRDGAGREVFRAAGAPRLPHLLAAMARAVPPEG